MQFFLTSLFNVTGKKHEASQKHCHLNWGVCNSDNGVMNGPTCCTAQEEAHGGNRNRIFK